MAYTSFDRQSAPGRTTLRTMLVLAAGVMLGLMITRVSFDATVHEAMNVAPIAGEDWHGNVRRSGP
ncbi:hypothetical protein [Roseobacter sinensis]|uniref:Uncharacterized protein n=1 Tax=Roseobacter sinensis TaxID=2931391 RepID=A0ABT3BCA8_9RHOB|nr:hypothetical protein [Roseobacter sp. WL0113]MCV3271201.1 hypothetical protein [Roseobacter sp. WL0113]